MMDHPKTYEDLQKKPGQVNDHKFLEHHKDFEAFLGAHASLRQQFAGNPTLVIHHENVFGRDANELTLAEMDHFLDKHKHIAKELEENPSRATDQKYLDHHKDLARFFDDQPEVRKEFAQNPSEFMQRETQFEQREHNNHMDNRNEKKDENKNLDHREDMSTDRAH